MRSIILMTGLAFGMGATMCRAAQEATEFSAPQKEHEWLNQCVGEWETETEAVVQPGQPPLKCTGTMSSRALGGFWIASHMTSEMMGTLMAGGLTIGYAPKTK